MYLFYIIIFIALAQFRACLITRTKSDSFKCMNHLGQNEFKLDRQIRTYLVEMGTKDKDKIYHPIFFYVCFQLILVCRNFFGMSSSKQLTWQILACFFFQVYSTCLVSEQLFSPGYCRYLYIIKTLHAYFWSLCLAILHR